MTQEEMNGLKELGLTEEQIQGLKYQPRMELFLDGAVDPGHQEGDETWEEKGCVLARVRESDNVIVTEILDKPRDLPGRDYWSLRTRITKVREPDMPDFRYQWMQAVQFVIDGYEAGIYAKPLTQVGT